ncbi:MAG TPA: ATP-binding cassette domain-containing protein [Candidatus Cloacimonadota bacterium]|nr:ATP-binding cassette domain-containing protein [Candidatus Cloacimonadota bacterium]HPK41441.1 ATP-binding cassette domain-containing protein [Candidatus Cloacimonadota bacterium]
MNTTIQINNIKHPVSSTSWLEIENLQIETKQNILVNTRVNSGLSTFLKLISGVIGPESGEILIFGEDLRYCSEVNYEKIKRMISYSYQHGVMVSNLTIFENLMLSLNFNMKELTNNERIQYVNDFIRMYKISQYLHKRPVELGFMQRKIFGIIRSCIISPNVLVLDEPFQNFEKRYTDIVESLIERHIANGNNIILGTSLTQHFDFINETIDYFPYVQRF